MSDILKGFFVGMEEFAKTMREYALVAEQHSGDEAELKARVVELTARVESLVNLLEDKLGTVIEIAPAKAKRMMDIKQKVIENVEAHPDGIRPPQLARILGTKVQNLYPHLKVAVTSKRLIRDERGTYYPAEAANGKAAM